MILVLFEGQTVICKQEEEEKRQMSSRTDMNSHFANMYLIIKRRTRERQGQQMCIHNNNCCPSPVPAFRLGDYFLHL